MASLAKGWSIQVRVLKALLIRELSTRFGRENIGFLWMVAEPALFPALVAVMWRLLKGPEEHGINIMAFVVSGYVPLTLFRHGLGRSVGLFTANSSLMYHRQIKVLDFIIVRFLIEFIGSMMSYTLIATIMIQLDLFPIPADIGLFLAGWCLYGLFSFSLCLILAPVSEMSEIAERFVSVTTYIAIPFAGTFNMVSWLSPHVRQYMLYSPFVDAMEMMRYGLWGNQVTSYYDPWIPIWASIGCMVVGLTLCRRVRRTLVVE